MTKDNNKTAQTFSSMDFFHYLQERPSERYSRFEAYIYMLDKACACYRPQGIEPKWIPTIGDGQFFITKTQLANDWHWHRATVRDYLDKLTDFGCLVVEEHLKGILCTMTRLVVTVNNSIAVAYNFDSMAKYTMYGFTAGKYSPSQVDRICRHIHRGASSMLNGTFLSPYLEKELEDVTKVLLHYLVEGLRAHSVGEFPHAKDISLYETTFEKRLMELFAEHLDGSWTALLTLMSKETSLAFDTLFETVNMGKADRTELFTTLREVAAALPEVSLPAVKSTEESAAADCDIEPENSHSESDSEAVEASSSSQTDKSSE